jgi:HEAT repeat protein
VSLGRPAFCLCFSLLLAGCPRQFDPAPAEGEGEISPSAENPCAPAIPFHEETLVGALRRLVDQSALKQEEVEEVLAPMGLDPSAALPAVARVFEDKGSSRAMGCAAARAMEYMAKLPGSDRTVLPGVVALLEHRDREPHHRWHLIRILGLFGPSAVAASAAIREYLARDDAEGRVDAAEALCRIDPSVKEQWTGDLSSADRAVRCRAFELLCGVARVCPDVLPRLLTVPDDEMDPVPCYPTGGGLVAIGEPLVPFLLQEIRKPGGFRRSFEFLGRMGPEAKAAIRALIEMAKDESRESERSSAIRALVEIAPGNPEAAEAVPTLVRILRDAESPPYLRGESAQLLGVLGEAAGVAVPYLDRLLLDSFPQTGKAYGPDVEIARALWRIAPTTPQGRRGLLCLLTAANTVWGSGKDEKTGEEVRTFQDVNEREVVEVILEGFSDSWSRSIALRALVSFPEIRVPNLAGRLEKMLFDPEERTRSLCVQVLGQSAREMSEGAARDRIVGTVLRSLQDPSPSVREAACCALCGFATRSIRTQECIGGILGSLDDPDGAVRAFCVAAIAGMFEEGPRENDPQFARRILDLRADPSPAVRRAVFKHLNVLAWKPEYCSECRTALERGAEDADDDVRGAAKYLLSCFDD